MAIINFLPIHNYFVVLTGFALCDILQRPEEEVPKIQSKVLCRHPFDVQKRAFATPSQIDELQKVTNKYFNSILTFYGC